ncbi:MAG: hypothetical protein R3E32_29780 [Chitinophagales bacterium]
MEFVNALNSKAFQYIFLETAEEKFLLAFLNCFVTEKLDIELAKITSTSIVYSNSLFQFKGCLQDGILIEAISRRGSLVFLQVDILNLHWGVTNIEILATDSLSFYSDEMAKIQKDVEFIHLAFIHFDINKSGNREVIKTNIYSRKMNFKAHFLWFHLPLFNFDASQLTELEQWIFFLCRSVQCQKIPAYIDSQTVRLAFQKANPISWEKEDLDWYQKYETEFPIRQKKINNHYRKAGLPLHPDFLQTSPPYANLKGWKPFLKSLGVYPKQDVLSSDINIGNTDLTLVFSLFRYWTKQVKSALNQVVEIKNEQDLIKDFQEELKEAVVHLYLEDSFLKEESDKEWGAELLASLVNVKLNLRWHFEYLIKNTELFKTSQALRAILVYLAANEIEEMKMDDIYQQLLEEASNLQAISKEIELQKESKWVHINAELYQTRQSQVRTVLKNLMGKRIKEISEETKNLTFYLRGAESLHDLENLKQVIAINRSLFE